MKAVTIPNLYNYIGVFLTFACNLHCSYCINHQYGATQHYKQLEAKDWIRGLNRIVSRDDLPITLQGGEPTLYRGLYDIIANVDNVHIDILTNLQVSTDDWIAHVRPERLKRTAKYASIRVSYHPEQMDLEALMYKVKKLQDHGFSIGVWIVEHPANKSLIYASRDILIAEGIDCRLKEFLGEYKGKFYGTYKYQDSVDSKTTKTVICRPSEMLIAPDGSIHRCHNSLYMQHKGYGNILDSDIRLMEDHIPCSQYGHCNSCDTKLKTNRFQVYGHASVDIIQ